MREHPIRRWNPCEQAFLKGLQSLQQMLDKAVPSALMRALFVFHLELSPEIVLQEMRQFGFLERKGDRYRVLKLPTGEEKRRGADVTPYPHRDSLRFLLAWYEAGVRDLESRHWRESPKPPSEPESTSEIQLELVPEAPEKSTEDSAFDRLPPVTQRELQALCNHDWLEHRWFGEKPVTSFLSRRVFKHVYPGYAHPLDFRTEMKRRGWMDSQDHGDPNQALRWFVTEAGRREYQKFDVQPSIDDATAAEWMHEAGVRTEAAPHHFLDRVSALR